MSVNVSREAELWGKLYGLLCRYPDVQYALAGIPPADQVRLDDLAEQIIAESGAFENGQS